MHCISHAYSIKPSPQVADIQIMTRMFGLLSILTVFAVSGYAFAGKTSIGGLNPLGKVSDAEARAERANATYTLAIVSGQLAQVHVVTGTYADTLDFDNPLVRLVRADANSYCLEYEKTQTYFLAGPGGTVALGTC
jgi:hypothetical protein